jgi:N-acetylmuramoyl-L-alanine amidase
MQKLLVMSVIISFFSPFAHAYRILIDPGHGGHDLGATLGTLTEASIVWAWALDLKKLLLERGFEVEMSRSETKGLSLHKRVTLLNQKKYDLVLSLHANYILDPRVKGVEYYVATPLDLEDQKLQLAHEEVQLKSGEKKSHADLGTLNQEQKSQVSAIINDLQKQSQMQTSLGIAEKLNQNWHGHVRQGPFDLLSQSESPAVLVELGYLSNPADLKNLTDIQFRLEKNSKIAESISSYFKNQDRPIVR